MEQNIYQFDPEYIQQRTQEMRDNLKRNGKSDFAGFAAKVLFDRLIKNPMQYLEFGVYWWALKNALHEKGYFFGEQSNEALANQYKGAGIEETFVMAEMFKDHYRETWFVGTNSFDLEDGSTYFLFDEDMETRSK